MIAGIPSVIAINVGEGLVLFSDGEVSPVAEWVDAEGDVVDTSDKAFAAIVQHSGKWHVVVLGDFNSKEDLH